MSPALCRIPYKDDPILLTQCQGLGTQEDKWIVFDCVFSYARMLLQRYV